MKLSKEVLDIIGERKTIRMFVIVKDECHEMRLSLAAWKFLYEYQEKTKTGFNEILREALTEFFKNRVKE